MSDSETNTDDKERASLLLEIARLQSDLRRRLLTVVEHPGMFEDFKSNPVVKEWVK